MILKRLHILNYKNIAEAEIDFSPKINCFVGHNGEGKTNLLDAIFFLSFTRSTNNMVDSMNIRHGEDVMMLQGIYDINGSEEEFTCGLKLHQKKIFRHNKKAYRKLTDHIGLLPLIIISPNDHILIMGGSEERRRFMDMVISQYDSCYMNSLIAHNKALAQRNILLRKAKDNAANAGGISKSDFEMIELYEEIMASEGEKIYQMRQQFIDEFCPIFQHYYNRISGGEESVGLAYTSHCQRGPLLDVIRRDRMKDIIMGYSLHGVHKDDIEMTLDGYPLKKEASQGQNKTYLICLKLAQFDFLSRTGSRTTPLLLFDDIFDKLDAQRMEQIISLCANPAFGQIFITDTNRENLDRILQRAGNDYRLFHVESGTIR